MADPELIKTEDGYIAGFDKDCFTCGMSIENHDLTSERIYMMSCISLLKGKVSLLEGLVYTQKYALNGMR